jgi:hypothetical protein
MWPRTAYLIFRQEGRGEGGGGVGALFANLRGQEPLDVDFTVGKLVWEELYHAIRALSSKFRVV